MRTFALAIDTNHVAVLNDRVLNAHDVTRLRYGEDAARVELLESAVGDENVRVNEDACCIMIGIVALESAACHVDESLWERYNAWIFRFQFLRH